MKKTTLILLVALCSITLSAQKIHETNMSVTDTIWTGNVITYYDSVNSLYFNIPKEFVHSNVVYDPVYFQCELQGLIEIDGHTFLNDTCDCPIIYKATLDKITISDCNGKEYTHRICGEKDCQIIHLVEKISTEFNPYNLPGIMYFNNLNDFKSY